mmetsp:Transcript_2994/g.5414  ORF Transcript_2994/g.5414 Transcript_2994/m.5414 type:complete len:113 (+) Transcript_2994:529-867(+)
MASLGSRTALPGPVAQPALAAEGNAAVESPPATTRVATWFKKSPRVVEVLCNDVETVEGFDAGANAAAEPEMARKETRENFMLYCFAWSSFYSMGELCKVWHSCVRSSHCIG